MNKRFIPVAAPTLEGNEKKYVMDCLDTTWISSTGQYIDRFEADFAKFCGTKHAVSCSNGTVALHLALLALNLQAGDEVIVPTLTFIASANAVTYCGATPVFVDVEADIWTVNPQQIEAKITPRTKGIIAVHLAGHPADMVAINAIAKKHNLFVLEDAAQAHGAEVNGQRVGSLGVACTFSFFGNKIISTGEGGMVTTNNDELSRKMRLLKNHGMEPQRRYWHPVVGYNYRMTNIQAAIGVAQVERVDWQLAQRAKVVDWYREELADIDGISWQQKRDWARHVWWMFTAILDDAFNPSRDGVMNKLAVQGIETRRVVYPMHQLPPYDYAGKTDKFPVADHLAQRGINLPTYATLTRDDVHFVCSALLACKAKKS